MLNLLPALLVAASGLPSARADVPGLPIRPPAAWTVGFSNGAGGSLESSPFGTELLLSVNSTSNRSTDPMIQAIAADGTTVWKALWAVDQTAYLGGVPSVAADADGNYFIAVPEPGGQLVLTSLTREGGLRWTKALDDIPMHDTKPVIGWNGSVYVAEDKGRGTATLVGYDAATGKQTLAPLATYGGAPAWTGQYLYAYKDGLVTADGYTNTVQYRKYDGSIVRSVDADPAISYATNFSYTAQGTDGTVFMAGYPRSCQWRDAYTPGQTHLSVSKITPDGRAWTWTDPQTVPCGPVKLASTPNGGVVVARNPNYPGTGGEFLSLTTDGQQKPRWRLNRDDSPASTNLGVGTIAPRVDSAGHVVLSSMFYYECGLSDYPCTGIRLDFVMQGSATPFHDQLTIPDFRYRGYEPADLGVIPNHAVVADRDVINGAESNATAYFVDGLGHDFRMSLLPPATSPSGDNPAGGSGGPGGTAPTGNPAQPGSPLGSAGTGGVIVVPGSGTCDPGSDNDWLHIAGVTFVCVLSGQALNDPEIVSAKKACIVTLGLDATGFQKVLKAPDYARALGKAGNNLKKALTEIKTATYPGKVSKDAAAVEDVRTAAHAIKGPDDLILTIISSRRVLDGLTLKLRKGDAAAKAAATYLDIAKVSLINVIELASGIVDIKDCVAAFKH